MSSLLLFLINVISSKYSFILHLWNVFLQATIPYLHMNLFKIDNAYDVVITAL